MPTSIKLTGFTTYAELQFIERKGHDYVAAKRTPTGATYEQWQAFRQFLDNCESRRYDASVDATKVQHAVRILRRHHGLD